MRACLFTGLCTATVEKLPLGTCLFPGAARAKLYTFVLASGPATDMKRRSSSSDHASMSRRCLGPARATRVSRRRLSLLVHKKHRYESITTRYTLSHGRFTVRPGMAAPESRGRRARICAAADFPAVESAHASGVDQLSVARWLGRRLGVDPEGGCRALMGESYQLLLWSLGQRS